MPLTATYRHFVDARLTKSLDLSTPIDAVNKDEKTAFTNGTGADQGDLLWHDTRTIVASGTDDLDLNGVLTDAFGDTVSALRVKAIYIKNTSAVATIGVAAAPAAGWTNFPFSSVAMQPGESRSALSPGATGLAVTAGSSDTIRVTNNDGGNAATYDIIVIAASA